MPCDIAAEEGRKLSVVIEDARAEWVERERGSGHGLR